MIYIKHLFPTCKILGDFDKIKTESCPNMGLPTLHKWNFNLKRFYCNISIKLSLTGHYYLCKINLERIDANGISTTNIHAGTPPHP